MINDAIAAYLRTISALDVYLMQAPAQSGRCIVLDDNGDSRQRHWQAGTIATGIKEQEYELTVWADLNAGGSRWAAQQAESLLSLLDNFAGPLVDTAASPNVTHNITLIEATDGGGGFDAGPELYGHSVFLTVNYK